MTRRYLTTYGHRKRQRAIRTVNHQNNRCINDNRAGTHGPPTHGVRCSACYEVHKRSW